MAGLFGKSEPPPEPKEQAPLPQEDDEAARRAALKERTRLLTQSSGRLANQLGQTSTSGATYKPAPTRKGNQQLGMATSGMSGQPLLTG